MFSRSSLFVLEILIKLVDIHSLAMLKFLHVVHQLLLPVDQCQLNCPVTPCGARSRAVGRFGAVTNTERNVCRNCSCVTSTDLLLQASRKTMFLLPKELTFKNVAAVLKSLTELCSERTKFTSHFVCVIRMRGSSSNLTHPLSVTCSLTISQHSCETLHPNAFRRFIV